MPNPMPEVKGGAILLGEGGGGGRGGGGWAIQTMLFLYACTRDLLRPVLRRGELTTQG